MKLIILNSLEPMKLVLFMTNFRFFINYFSVAPILLISSALLLISCGSNDFKTGYIDINVINKEYTLAQHYETRLKYLEDVSAQDLFDLQNQINEISKSIKKQQDNKKEVTQEALKAFYLLKIEFNKKQEASLKMIEDSTLHYRTILNTDINNKVFLFGKENDYKYLFNPAGSGTFMFADSSLNISKQIVLYLNSKNRDDQ